MRKSRRLHCLGEQRGRDERSGAPEASFVENRARARRGRIYWRRLPDRCPAGARSPVIEPVGQPVRCLRGNQRGVVDRGADGQRRHAGADDAHGQRSGAVRTAAARARDAAAPEQGGVRAEGAQAAAARRQRAAQRRGQPRLAVGGRRGAGAGRRAAVGHLHRRGRRGVRAQGAVRGRPDRRLPSADPRAVPGGDRPGHVRADRARRRGLGRHPDLRRRARLDRAADGLRALPRARARAGRRRDRLHHQPRHRRRGGRALHRRRQPARALRQRLLEDDPDAVRHPRPARLGHGLPEDRLPDVQAARLPAPARDGAATGRPATRASTSS